MGDRSLEELVDRLERAALPPFGPLTASERAQIVSVLREYQQMKIAQMVHGAAPSSSSSEAPATFIAGYLQMQAAALAAILATVEDHRRAGRVTTGHWVDYVATAKETADRSAHDAQASWEQLRLRAKLKQED